MFTIYGVGLFIAPSGFDSAWPWALTPLTARAIASFLLGFAVAAAIAVSGNCLLRFPGPRSPMRCSARSSCWPSLIHSTDFDSGAALPLFLAFFATCSPPGSRGRFPTRRSACFELEQRLFGSS